MASKCFPLVRGRVMRVTRLDGCGRPVPGPDSVVTTEGFVSVGLTSNTEEGEAISVTNANGKVCVSDTPPPVFTGYDVEVVYCNVDPELFALMTGQKTVEDAQGNIVGFRVNSDVSLDDSGFALELWSSVPAQQCDPDAAAGTGEYGYFLLPFVKGGVLGDFTIENAAVSFSLTGASTKGGSTWGVGPYDVVADDVGACGPLLEPIEAGDHLHLQLTTCAPPEAMCGSTSLGDPATGATAGNPGTFTPANTYGPMTLADAGSLTASPTTAWVSPQHIVLGDGSTAHWDGAAWVAGKPLS